MLEYGIIISEVLPSPTLISPRWEMVTEGRVRGKQRFYQSHLECNNE